MCSHLQQHRKYFLYISRERTSAFNPVVERYLLLDPNFWGPWGATTSADLQSIKNQKKAGNKYGNSCVEALVVQGMYLSGLHGSGDVGIQKKPSSTMESTLEHVQHGLVLDHSSRSQMETLPGLAASLDFLPSYHQTSSQNPRRTCFRRFRREVKLQRCKSLNLGCDTQERKQITGIFFLNKISFASLTTCLSFIYHRTFR